MKRCFKCNTEKALTEFYKHSKMADGYLNKCKECAKLDVKQHRRENDSVREYDRNRGNRQSGDYLKQYRAKYPKKYSAHTLVNSAIRCGRMDKVIICECGSDFHVEAHHDDYDKPLEVRWLCAVCNQRWHAKYGEALNPF